MDVNEYLRTFLAELHRLRPVPDYDECDHSIGLGKDGELEIRLSAGDFYKVALISMLDLDPVKAANEAASAPCKFTHPAAGHLVLYMERPATQRCAVACFQAGRFGYSTKTLRDGN